MLPPDGWRPEAGLYRAASIKPGVQAQANRRPEPCGVNFLSSHAASRVSRSRLSGHRSMQSRPQAREPVCLSIMIRE